MPLIRPPGLTGTPGWKPWSALRKYGPSFVLTSWLTKRIVDTVRSYIGIGLIGDEFKWVVGRSGFDVSVLTSAQRYSLPVNLFIPYVRRSFGSPNPDLELINGLLIPFEEDNENFLLRHPSVHIWRRDLF